MQSPLCSAPPRVRSLSDESHTHTPKKHILHPMLQSSPTKFWVSQASRSSCKRKRRGPHAGEPNGPRGTQRISFTHLYCTSSRERGFPMALIANSGDVSVSDWAPLGCLFIAGSFYFFQPTGRGSMISSELPSPSSFLPGIATASSRSQRALPDLKRKLGIKCLYLRVSE